MPPPMPLSGASDAYSSGSQAGSSRSSANAGRIVSHATSGELALEIAFPTAATNSRTVAVSRMNSSLLKMRSSELAHRRLVRERDDRALGAGIEHRLHLVRRRARDHAQIGMLLLDAPH